MADLRGEQNPYHSFDSPEGESSGIDWRHVALEALAGAIRLGQTGFWLGLLSSIAALGMSPVLKNPAHNPWAVVAPSIVIGVLLCGVAGFAAGLARGCLTKPESNVRSSSAGPLIAVRCVFFSLLTGYLFFATAWTLTNPTLDRLSVSSSGFQLAFGVAVAVGLGCLFGYRAK